MGRQLVMSVVKTIEIVRYPIRKINFSHYICRKKLELENA